MANFFPPIIGLGDRKLKIQKNGVDVATFSANEQNYYDGQDDVPVIADITVPTKVSELTNDSGYTTNTGTVTKVSTGVGLTGGDVTTTGTIKTKLRSETALTRDSVAATETANRVYPVVPDKTGYLAVNVPWTDTTYSSKSAASGGTDVSLVTTGEKYTWNNKSDLTIGTTATTAAAGNHTHTTTIAADSGTSALDMAAGTVYKLTAGGSNFIFKTPADNNTDTKVKQTATTTDSDYEVLFSSTADNTTRTEGARKNNNLLFNPSTGNLQATQLNGVTIGSSPKFTDTTYESKAAASGGTAVSLVTTGEKYTWNNKSDLTIGTTASTAAAGNHTHNISIATDSGTNQLTLAANTKYKITAGGSSYIFTTPPDNNTTYSAGTGLSLSGGAFSVNYGTAAGTACQGNDSRLSDSRTPTSHTHGNIQNGGTLQTNDITIASGDKLVVTDSSDSAKVARTSISFDGSTATKALTQKGTWETFGTSNLTIGTTASTAAAGNHTHGLSMATDSGTSSISLAANTKYKLTAGGSTYVFTTPQDTNTWRGIQDNLTSSTNTTESLSAKQGYLLANGSARDSTKLPLSGGTMTGQIKTSFHESVAMGSYQASATTIENLCSELRYSSGCCGSFSLGTAYTKDGITIAGGWYNFLWIPHRSGGNSGAASGDNCNYGTCFITGMTVNNAAYILHYSNSVITELKNLYQDTLVSQTATSTSAEYEVLFSSTADNTTRTEGARKNSNLKFNPSTGNLQPTMVTLNSHGRMQYNATTASIDFSFV